MISRLGGASGTRAAAVGMAEEDMEEVDNDDEDEDEDDKEDDEDDDEEDDENDVREVDKDAAGAASAATARSMQARNGASRPGSAKRPANAPSWAYRVRDAATRFRWPAPAAAPAPASASAPPPAAASASVRLAATVVSPQIFSVPRGHDGPRGPRRPMSAPKY